MAQQTTPRKPPVNRDAQRELPLPQNDRFDRSPPYNEQAEKGVLGGIMLFNDYLDEVSGIIKPEHFFLDPCQRIYRAILRLHEKRKPFDAVTVAEALERSKDIPEIGGLSYLHEVIGSVPHAANSRYYAGIIRDKWMQRELARICNDAIRDAFDNATDSRELLDQTTAKILDLSQDAMQARDGATELTDVFIQHYEALTARMAGKSPGIESGFRSIDHVTQGYHPKTMHTVAARPGGGKTAWMCQVFRNVIEHRPLFFSLEQPYIQIADRLLSQATQIPLNRLRKGQLSDDERDQILTTASALSQSPCFIHAERNKTLSQLATIARVAKRKHGIGIILLDYLQLIVPENRRAPEHEQVTQLSRDMASLADELGVAIVVLAQMNREIDKRVGKEKRPKMSDLRGSGAIEADSFTVSFLHLQSKYDPDAPLDEAEFIVAKNKDGDTGTIRLKWNGPTITFEDLTTDPNMTFESQPGGFYSASDYYATHSLDG